MKDNVQLLGSYIFKTEKRYPRKLKKKIKSKILTVKFGKKHKEKKQSI